MRLSGVHALVTGGGTGIGAAIAHALHAEGARLTLVGRRQAPLDEVAAAIGANVALADVTDTKAVAHAFAEARAAHGPIGILINNAGAAASKAFRSVTAHEWREAMAVNLDGVLHCSQAALPDLLDAPAGRIVTIASTAGLKGYAYTAPYVAAKHAAVGLMRALAAEFASSRMTANAVCPGFTDTAIVADAITHIAGKTGQSNDAARDALTRFNPQGRLVTPNEVAATVTWLCLPDSQSINGQAIAVAGGEL